MKKLKAILFDVDGTLANTERDGHRVAFNRAFVEAGLDWDWDETLYGALLSVTGGKERIIHYVTDYHIKIEADSVEAFAAALHRRKTAHYLALLSTGKIPLRDGVKTLLEEPRAAGVLLAIATTTTPENVTALLENQLGADAVEWFEVIGAGDMVPNKKPAPDIYTYVMDALGLSVHDCVAIEDSSNGLKSAQAAGLKTLVTTNDYTIHEDLSGADIIVDGIGSPEAPFSVTTGNVFGHSHVNVALLDSMLE